MLTNITGQNSNQTMIMSREGGREWDKCPPFGVIVNYVISLCRVSLRSGGGSWTKGVHTIIPTDLWKTIIAIHRRRRAICVNQIITLGTTYNLSQLLCCLQGQALDCLRHHLDKNGPGSNWEVTSLHLWDEIRHLKRSYLETGE